MDEPTLNPKTGPEPAAAAPLADADRRAGPEPMTHGKGGAEEHPRGAGSASPQAEPLVPAGGQAGGPHRADNSLYQPSWPPRGGARKAGGAAVDKIRSQSPPGDEPADEGALELGPTVKRLSGENMDLLDLPPPLQQALAQAEASLERADSPPSRVARGVAGGGISPSSARVLFPGGDIISLHQDDDPGAWSPRKVNRGTGNCLSMCFSKPPPPRFA